MSKNPIINGVSASVYILLLVLILNTGMRTIEKEDSFFAPVVMISVFTLSAAVMFYIFCLQPLMLYLEGKKKVAVNLFIQTVGVFGLITMILLALVFFGVF